MSTWTVRQFKEINFIIKSLFEKKGFFHIRIRKKELEDLENIEDKLANLGLKHIPMD